jgi:hypothetical protein
LEFNLVVMRQEAITLREVCDVYKKYRLDTSDPEVMKWYYRLKAKDDQTVSNLQNYLNRKVFNPKTSNPES